MIELKELRELLYYCEYSGNFYRLQNRAKYKTGELAGFSHTNGYIQIHVKGRTYFAHRLAWFYMNGAWPKDQIDHKNGSKSDNRKANLREATRLQNIYNKGKSIRNKSGYKGVSWNRVAKKWVAQIRINGSVRNLGSFSCPKAAFEIYKDEAIKLHNEFVRF